MTRKGSQVRVLYGPLCTAHSCPVRPTLYGPLLSCTAHSVRPTSLTSSYAQKMRNLDSAGASVREFVQQPVREFGSAGAEDGFDVLNVAPERLTDAVAVVRLEHPRRLVAEQLRHKVAHPRVRCLTPYARPRPNSRRPVRPSRWSGTRVPFETNVKGWLRSPNHHPWPELDAASPGDPGGVRE